MVSKFLAGFLMEINGREVNKMFNQGVPGGGFGKGGFWVFGVRDKAYKAKRLNGVKEPGIWSGRSE